MTLSIEPINEDAGACEFPIGFWPAFCVETPAASVLGCEYTNESRERTKYEHDGFVGDWVSE